MGLSSSTQTNKPIYGSQISGAGDTLTGAYNAQAPKIGAITDSITGLIPGLLDRFHAGDRGINAAQDWATRTLGQNGENPHLQGMIDQSGQDMANQVNSNLGSRGNLGGSVHERILAHELGKNSMEARFNDYYQRQQQQAQAAGMTPGLAAGQQSLLNPVFQSAGAVTMPLDAASGYTQGIGSLLGQYQKTKTTQPWGSAVASAIAGGANAAMAGGWKPFGKKG